ncbi:hypothetical protein KUCAC02_009325, partial [Chaenocephalus aceratus]
PRSCCSSLRKSVRPPPTRTTRSGLTGVHERPPPPKKSPQDNGLKCSLPTESCLNGGRCEGSHNGNGECNHQPSVTGGADRGQAEAARYAGSSESMWGHRGTSLVSMCGAARDYGAAPCGLKPIRCKAGSSGPVGAGLSSEAATPLRGPQKSGPCAPGDPQSGRSKPCHSEEIRGYLAVVGADSSQAQAVKRRNTSHCTACR